MEQILFEFLHSEYFKRMISVQMQTEITKNMLIFGIAWFLSRKEIRGLKTELHTLNEFIKQSLAEGKSRMDIFEALLKQITSFPLLKKYLEDLNKPKGG